MNQSPWKNDMALLGHIERSTMQEQSVLDYPVYVRMPTEENKTYFDNKSSAEAVINALITAQNQGWMRLHGFVVLPNGLEMVMSPIKQGVTGVVAHIQAEMTPVLAVLLPASLFVWGRYYNHKQIKTDRSLNARLNMLLLAPVAQGICDAANQYPYSSANARYKANVAVYAGFTKTVRQDNPVLKGTGPLVSSPTLRPPSPPAPVTPPATPSTPVIAPSGKPAQPPAAPSPPVVDDKKDAKSDSPSTGKENSLPS